MAVKMTGPSTGLTWSPLVVPTEQRSLDEVLTSVLTELLGCAQATLDPVPKLAFVATGFAVTWDDCCNGQTWSRLEAVDEVTAPKMGHAPQHPCQRTWAVTAGLGALRCSALSADGGSPGGPAMTADSLQVIRDQARLLTAIQCCVPMIPGLLTAPRITRWVSMGPEGGCVGGEWAMTLTVGSYDCAEPP